MLAVSVLRGYDNLVRDMFVRGVDKWVRADMPFSRISTTVDDWNINVLIAPMQNEKIFVHDTVINPSVYHLHSSRFCNLVTSVKAIVSKQSGEFFTCKIVAENVDLEKPSNRNPVETWETTFTLQLTRGYYVIERGETEIFSLLS